MYEKFISPGDFSDEMSNSHIQDHSTVFNLKILIKKSNCFKNLERPTDTDHILTKQLKFF